MSVQVGRQVALQVVALRGQVQVAVWVKLAGEVVALRAHVYVQV
jgi:hypothetical protein